MTHSEDIQRVKKMKFKDARIQALESRVEELEKKIVSLENKIEFLQAQNEVARQVMFNKY